MVIKLIELSVKDMFIVFMINNSVVSKSSVCCGICLVSNVLLRKFLIKLLRLSVILL